MDIGVGSVAPATSSTDQKAASLRSFASLSTNSYQNSSSNISGIEWQDLLGGSYGETLSSIQQTPDRGYIACGEEGSLGGDGNVESSHGGGDVWVVKFDSTGNLTWQKSFGGSNYDQAFSIRPTSDGGYVFAGETNSSTNGDVGQNHGGKDAWIVKLDSTGNLTWQTVLGGSNDDQAISIRQTSDGYIFSGITGATRIVDGVTWADRPYMGGHAWVVKLDSGGTVQWQKVFGGNGDEIANSIVHTSDGGYAFVATTSSSDSGDVGTNHGNTDMWVVKLDPTGTIQWTKLLGGSGWDFTSPWFDDGIQQTSDGGYVVIGTTGSNDDGDVGVNHGSGDIWVAKLDSSGQHITWQNVLGGNSMEWGVGIRQTPDNGYIFSGITESNNNGDAGPGYGNGDYWVGKLDSSGSLQWQLPMGGSGYDQAEDIQPTSDGGYIVTGRSDSSNSGMVTETNHGHQDAWVVKLTPRFTVRVRDSDTGAYIPNATVGLYDYPNKKWQNLTTSNGPVAIKGATGSNPFVFENGSVFGLSVSADGYPTKYENVKFLFTNQTVDVWLTSFNRPAIEKTFSITQVGNPGWPAEDQTDIAEMAGTGVSSHLSENGWTQVFRKRENEVSKEDFGTTGGGLNDATFHFHIGHGGKDLIFWGNTFLALGNGQSLHASDVEGKWGGKNKWVFLDSCDILDDNGWGKALVTTHGIFGFSTYEKSGPSLVDQFFAYATWPQYRYSLAQAYKQATIDEVDDATAKVIFDNEDQYLNDHLPGMGIVAPDENPDDDYDYQTNWSC